MIPEAVIREGVVLRAIERVLCVVQRGNAARKIQRRRSPILRLLIVAGDSRDPGNIQLVRKVRGQPRRLAVELVSERGREPLRRARRPLNSAVNAESSS